MHKRKIVVFPDRRTRATVCAAGYLRPSGLLKVKTRLFTWKHFSRTRACANRPDVRVCKDALLLYGRLDFLTRDNRTAGRDRSTSLPVSFRSFRWAFVPPGKSWLCERRTVSMRTTQRNYFYLHRARSWILHFSSPTRRIVCWMHLRNRIQPLAVVVQWNDGSRNNLFQAWANIAPTPTTPQFLKQIEKSCEDIDALKACL